MKQQEKSGKGPTAEKFRSPTKPAELESTGILWQRWSSEDTGMVEFGRNLPRTEFSDLSVHSGCAQRSILPSKPPSGLCTVICGAFFYPTEFAALLFKENREEQKD